MKTGVDDQASGGDLGRYIFESRWLIVTVRETARHKGVAVAQNYIIHYLTRAHII